MVFGVENIFTLVYAFCHGPEQDYDRPSCSNYIHHSSWAYSAAVPVDGRTRLHEEIRSKREERIVL